MALPFFENAGKKRRDQILAVDLGSRTTKAVHVIRRGEELVLCGYAMLDAPLFEKTLSTELLTEHLKAINTAVGGKARLIALTAGVNDALVRTVDMPVLSPDDMRLVLKHNSRNYLQQDLSNYVFDCHVAATDTGNGKAVDTKGAAAGARKQK